MKLKVINFDSKNVFGSIKQAVFTSALSYAKMYELLHKQIWRKARYRIRAYTFGSLPTYNNRPVAFISMWNICSPSTAPYSYEGGDHTFGLNQLFVGQDYRQEYNGNPKDGIYHDDCYIQTKKITPGFAWDYIYLTICAVPKGEGENQTIDYDTYRFYSHDYLGNQLYNSINIEIEESKYYYLVVDSIKSGVTRTYLGEYSALSYPSLTGEFLNGRTGYGYQVWTNIGTTFQEHGDMIEVFTTNEVVLGASGGYCSPFIILFEDGTSIKITPAHYTYSKNGTKKSPPTYTVLPMVYLDTGDLAMDRVEFVDKWDTYFELIVHEDGEWWQDLIRPVSLIVAAVIIYCSWGTLSPLAKAIVVIGYAVYAAGVLTNNTNLMLIGGIMMAGVSLYTAFDSFTTTTATTSAQLSTMSTQQALASTPFAETFSGYASAAGMENLLVMPTVESYTSLTLEGLTTGVIPYAELGAQAGMSVADYVSLSGANAFSIDSLMSMGKDIYGMYNNVNQLLNSKSTSTTSTDTTSQSGVTVTMKNDNDIFDPTAIIDNVINNI